MKDCGGAESHGRGYHVRGVCVCVSGAERGTGGCNGRPIVSVFDFFWGHAKGNYLGYWEPQQKLLVLFKAKKMLQQTPTYLQHHSA